MAILSILHYPDPRLKKTAKPVDVIDDRVRHIVADMMETMAAAGGIGLAANQVNIQERIIVTDLSGHGAAKMVFINPKILKRKAKFSGRKGAFLYLNIVMRSNGQPTLKFRLLMNTATLSHLARLTFWQYACNMKSITWMASFSLKSYPPSSRNDSETNWQRWTRRKKNGHALDFLGTPQFAAVILEALLSHHEVAAVLTQPDKPAKRGLSLQKVQ